MKTALIGLLAVVVSVTAAVVFSNFRRLGDSHTARRTVYGVAFHRSDEGAAVTCTSVVKDVSGVLRCTVWSIVSPGQHAATAARLPAGAGCTAIEVDQQKGRWVCASPNT